MKHVLPHILIVDDDEDIARMVSVFLCSRGYCCDVARTGAQAIAEFESGAFDLVLTDLNMPSGDGLALIDCVRRSSHVPIVVCTAFEQEFRDRLCAFEDVTVLCKPFDSMTLLDLFEVELGLPPCERDACVRHNVEGE